MSKNKSVSKKQEIKNYSFQSVSSAELEKKIKNYDFKKPKKFTKEHLRCLNTVNENIIRIFSSNISSMLRAFCEIEMIKMEECRYMEYLSTLPDKTFIGLLSMNDIENSSENCTLIMHFPSTINFLLIDILLGGDGHGYNLSRGFTDIEIAILDNFYRKMAKSFEEAWQSLMEISCSLAGNETSPRLVQFISLDDSVIVLSFQIKIRDVVDKFSFCIPSISLDGLLRSNLSKIAKNNNKLEDEKEHMRRTAISNSLCDSTVELAAVLDTIMLNVHDIVNLQVSDVIPLKRSIDDNVIITIEGEPKFTARVGDRKIKKSVKICDIASLSDINEFNNIKF